MIAWISLFLTWKSEILITETGPRACWALVRRNLQEYRGPDFVSPEPPMALVAQFAYAARG